jgi:excisionase family DNA binding protein
VKALTVSDVARRFGVAPQTVRRWADAGDLPSWRTVGGARRFDEKTIEKIRRGEAQ